MQVQSNKHGQELTNIKRCLLGKFFGTVREKFLSKIRDTPLMYKIFQNQKLSETPKGPPTNLFRHCEMEKCRPKYLIRRYVFRYQKLSGPYEKFQYCGTIFVVIPHPPPLFYGLPKISRATHEQCRL